MMPASLVPVANHLWQSTLCVLVAWLLTLALRKNGAAVRYRIWLAASIKFLIPFSLLTSAGAHLGTRTTPPSEPARFSIALEELSRPIRSAPPNAPRPVAATVTEAAAEILFSVWLCGLAACALTWLRRWRSVSTAMRRGTPLHCGLPIPVISTPARLEPGVFGIRRPVLLLPEGIRDHLTPAQLDAIVAHELCHWRRRDNLTAAMHMVVEAIFWFYPAVWWIRVRLLAERERACDQEVLRNAADPRSYAEGILNVCRFYLAAPAACISGVMGSDLRKRIEDIMENRVARNLNRSRKLLLAVAAAAIIAAPVIIGIESAPLVLAEPQSQPAAFASATIVPSAIWKAGGEGSKRAMIEYSPSRLTMRNVDLHECINWAWSVNSWQLAAPDYPGEERFDIVAEAGEAVPSSRLRLMLRDLLAKKFGVSVHAETKVLPVYELRIAEGGPKLPAAIADSSSRVTESLPRVQGDSFVFQQTSMPEFAQRLSMLRGIDRPVVDRTGIEGAFDITLASAPSAILQAGGPSLPALIEEQLGLKLIPASDPVEMIVIDRLQQPEPTSTAE